MKPLTPCAESRHCYYQDYKGDGKYCRVLNPEKDGGAPFEDGKCAFYKKCESDFSGGLRYEIRRSCEPVHC